LRLFGDDARLVEARGKVVKRRASVLPFFGRGHFLNRELGKLRHRILKSFGILKIFRQMNGDATRSTGRLNDARSVSFAYDINRLTLTRSPTRNSPRSPGFFVASTRRNVQTLPKLTAMTRCQLARRTCAQLRFQVSQSSKGQEYSAPERPFDNHWKRLSPRPKCRRCHICSPHDQ